MFDDTNHPDQTPSAAAIVDAFARRYGTAKRPDLEPVVALSDRYANAMQRAHHARQTWHQALERACAQQPALATARATLEAAERFQQDAHEALLTAILDALQAGAAAAERAS